MAVAHPDRSPELLLRLRDSVVIRLIHISSARVGVGVINRRLSDEIESHFDKPKCWGSSTESSSGSRASSGRKRWS